MVEYFGNVHMHTTYSDGTGTFDELVAAARRARLDFVYVTDHNILVRDREEGYRQGVLTLVGQEVHDRSRVPERSHLLCLGVKQDVTPHAVDPQGLIDAVNEQQGLAFLAHPIDPQTRLLPRHFSWEDWHVTGYTGIELWNYMSVFRQFTTSKAKVLSVAFLPLIFNRGPLPAVLRKWDELTQQRQVIAIGGTDVHAWRRNIGPIRRCFLPYDHCARALNTHILVDEPFLGAPTAAVLDCASAAVQHDRALVHRALRAGHCWLGYDLAAPTRGFRFTAVQVPRGQAADFAHESHVAHPPRAAHPVRAAQAPHAPDAIMGDRLAPPSAGWETLLRVKLPALGHMRLLRDGQLVAQRYGQRLDYRSAAPGVYRVEVRRLFWGQWRGWIYSNPIYVR